MPSFILGVLSMLCYGISNVYWKFAAKDEDYPYLVIFRGLFASLFLGSLWFLLNHYNFKYLNVNNANASLLDFLVCICLCLVCSLGLIFFLSSLKYQQLTITIPLTAINIFNILTTVFVLQESFRKIYFLSFPLTITGVLLIHTFQINKTNTKWNKGVLYAILASFFWGVTYPFFKYFSNKVGAITLSFISEVCVTFSAFIWLFISKQKISQQKNILVFKKIKHYIVLSVLLIGGTIFFTLSIQKISLITLNLLSNLQLVFSYSIGVIVFKEKVTTKQFIGALLILTSIFLTQYFT